MCRVRAAIVVECVGAAPAGAAVLVSAAEASVASVTRRGVVRMSVLSGGEPWCFRGPRGRAPYSGRMVGSRLTARSWGGWGRHHPAGVNLLAAGRAAGKRNARSSTAPLPRCAASTRARPTSTTATTWRWYPGHVYQVSVTLHGEHATVKIAAPE